MIKLIQYNLSYKKYLIFGVLLELLILLYFYLMMDNYGDIFRYVARYSGRLSLIIYLFCFYQYVCSFERLKNIQNTKTAVSIFCILHLIHFVFLVLSLYFNELPLIPFKVAGGFLAYIFIIIYPLIINKISKSIYHIIYFYYVGIVMLMTYVARIKGEFIGAEPELFHYVALIILLVAFLFFGYLIFSHLRKTKKFRF
tara:strand:- start:93 stop:686 length:594 start_codon:yes stop_codon:yes gene_type:complete